MVKCNIYIYPVNDEGKGKRECISPMSFSLSIRGLMNNEIHNPQRTIKVSHVSSHPSPNWRDLLDHSAICQGRRYS